MNVLVLIACIFAGVAVMVFLGERFARPMPEGTANRLSRWLIPLIGLLLVLRALDYYWTGG